MVKIRNMYYVVLGWSVWLSKTVPLHWDIISYLCTINRKVTVWEVKVIQFMRGQGHWYNATDKLSEYMWFSLCLSLQSRFAYEENIWSFEFLFCEKQDLCCSYKLICGLLFSNVSHTHQCRDTIEILTFIGIFARSEFLYSNDLTDS